MNVLNFFITSVYRLISILLLMELINKIKDLDWQTIQNTNWNDLLLSVAYNSMYFYSKVQIWFIKIEKNISPILSKITNKTYEILYSYIKVDKQNILQIEIYNFGDLCIGKTIHCTDFSKINDVIEDIQTKIGTEYNCIIYTDLTNKCANKIFYRQLTSNFAYEISNIKFLALMISYGDKCNVLIDLFTEEYNFYIVNNVIDKFFVMYFIKNVFKDTSIGKIENIKYTLTLYDENVQITTLDETDIITINKNDYSIIKYYDTKPILDDFVIT